MMAHYRQREKLEYFRINQSIHVEIVRVALSGLLFEYYVGVNQTQAFTVGTARAIGQPATGTSKFLGEKHSG